MNEPKSLPVWPAESCPLCEEFEAAWRSGGMPRAEEFLERVEAEKRDRLFARLLETELRVRQEHGEQPLLEEYCRRFPDRQGMVKALFRAHVRRRLGDYAILEQIGRGGMGVVYRAQHTLLNQTVALKVLTEPLLGDSQAVIRFRREMMSMGGLNHPHVIRALNAGEDRGVHFLVTEFVDGITLRELVHQQDSLAVGVACELIRQAAVGLQYVHAHGMVHRDIKPANLMLTRDGIVKILDLGLARLHSGGLQRELTLSGQPMGTVDYMAPEQWMDPSAVDIRADIYSLGCTLYFLLSGKAPTEADSRLSHPRTLLDRRAGALPSLVAIRPDCPAELQRVLDFMLAEEADDRFESPGEVVDAVGQFADARQLSALVQHAPWATGGKVKQPDAGRSDAYEVATRRGATASRTSPQHRYPRSKTHWFHYRELYGVGVALVVALVIWLALKSGRIHEVSPVDGPEAMVPLSAASVDEICALPGPNGPWWFDEIPWFTPFVRRAIAEELTQNHLATRLPALAGSPDNPALSPNVEVLEDWLLGRARDTQGRLTSPERTLLDELVRISQEDLTDERLAVRLQAGVERFCDELGPDGQWSAVDLHTRGVLQHKIAMIHSDRALAETAAGTYEAAIAAYALLGPATDALRARCLVDAGELYSRVLRDYPEAKRRFRTARAIDSVPVLLQVEAWVNEAIASAVANPDAAEKYAEAGYALTSAKQWIEDRQLGSQSHPFAAHVHERYAWILMDQWNVRKAAGEFLDARAIRFENYWKSKNDLAQIFVFHNDHGQAMAQRYCGDVKLARAQYDLVIGEIEKAVAKAGAEPGKLGVQRFRRELRERHSNSCERRADCELYQGAASGAPVDLKEAERLYGVARDDADDPAVRVAMTCKRAIALAMDGDVTRAAEELRQQDVQHVTVIGLQEERVRLLRNLASAVIKLKQPDTEAGLAALRTFLREFDLDPNYPDRHRRETQELQLFAAELLLATELSEPSRSDAAAADADYLDRLVAAFPYREQMLVYLRRYYDLLITARAQSDPDRAASYILASRDQRPTPGATLVLFHFTARQGHVVVRPTEIPSRCFQLAFGRDEIKSAAAGKLVGRSLSLPDELLDVLRDRRLAGEKTVMYWEDDKCWARAEDSLADQEWPFAHQLGLDGQLR